MRVCSACRAAPRRRPGRMFPIPLLRRTAWRQAAAGRWLGCRRVVRFAGRLAYAVTLTTGQMMLLLMNICERRYRRGHYAARLHARDRRDILALRYAGGRAATSQRRRICEPDADGSRPDGRADSDGRADHAALPGLFNDGAEPVAGGIGPYRRQLTAGASPLNALAAYTRPQAASSLMRYGNARFASSLLPRSYTTERDTTVIGSRAMTSDPGVEPGKASPTRHDSRRFVITPLGAARDLEC